MNADDMRAELDRLWARVSASGGAEPPPLAEPEILPPPSGIPLSLGSPSQAISTEMFSLLKRQRQEEVARLQELLSMKEQAVRELGERLQKAQAELMSLRRDEQRRERAALSDMTELAARLETADAALKDQERRFMEEERVLRDIAERTRQQLAAETARWRELERQWAEREQQYLLDIKEAQALLARAQEEAGKHEEKVRLLSDDMRQAKGAIEATLGELLTERRAREASDQDRDKALKRVAEVEGHFRELQKLWEEERKQWQELWERERSGWQAQRQDLSSWEERLRKERETWHAELKAKEEQELRFADQMTGLLREAAEIGARVAHLKDFSGIRFFPNLAQRARGWGASAAFAALAALALYPLWKHLHRVRLEPIASIPIALDSPTAVAFDGSQLWVSEWLGRLASLDPSDPANLLARYMVNAQAAYHPVSIALGGGALWSLDSAQGRIFKHTPSDPSLPQLSWPSPGPAPLALTHDGRSLWSYDAVNRAFYRHRGEGPLEGTEAFGLELDIVPSSMQWLGEELWLHDLKAKRLLRLKLSGKSFRVEGSTPCDPTILSIHVSSSRAAGGRFKTLWAIAGSSSGTAGYFLKRFKILP